MRTEPLRVVLGEADMSASPLRFVLEGEGFHLVGMAGCDDELRRVLAGVRPSAIVLDAGISAPAALEVRERYPDVPLVLAWPPGVVAVFAADRVDPAKVITDLGPAVRRAVARAAARTAARRALDASRPVDPAPRPPLVGIVRTPGAPPRPPRPQPAPRGRPVSRPTAFVASVALLYVLVGASVAFGLPYALHHVLRRPAAPYGSPSQVAAKSLGPAAPVASVGPRSASDRPMASPGQRGPRTGGGDGPRATRPHRPDRHHASQRRYPPRPDHPPAHPGRSGHPARAHHDGRPTASQRSQRRTGA